jgi:hypothetical protein
VLSVDVAGDVSRTVRASLGDSDDLPAIRRI